ncbi:MAG: GspH/FimT family pseudopilin [Armatimonadota bacterium]|nr:GspH/FimT family pseudopilin [Armatimonadota bacterium]
MGGARRGFSLVEALVAVALLGILVLVAVPRLTTPESVQVGVPARHLAADLRLAQRLAIARRATYTLEFSPAAPPYAAYVVRREGAGAEPDFPKTFAAGVTVTGPPQFTFRPDGSADGDGTVTLSSDGVVATLQVTAATGRVVVTAP